MNPLIIHILAAIGILVLLLILYCIGFVKGMSKGERNAVPEMIMLKHTNNALKSENMQLEQKIEDLDEQLDQALRKF